MKLTKENYELMMFDLLEGNLSEQEEQLLLQEIESDPFFNQEWKLFSETILEPETMVFAGKDGLLKEEKAVIIPLKSRLHIFSYAAAVAAIFLGVFWFAQRAPQGAEVVESAAPSDNKHIATQAIPSPQKDNSQVQASNEKSVDVREEDINPVPKVEQSGIANAPDKDNSKALDQNKQVVPQVITPEEEPLFDPSKIAQSHEQEMEDQKKIENQAPEKLEYKPREVLVNLTPKSPVIQTDKNDGNETVENILKPEQDLANMAAAPIVYTGLRSFLRRSAENAIRPFRNPKIRFNRVKNEEKPALNISFSSDAYYASAVVHLR